MESAAYLDCMAELMEIYTYVVAAECSHDFATAIELNEDSLVKILEKWSGLRSGFVAQRYCAPS